MAESFNSELHDALREAEGVTGQSARAAARATARGMDMAKCLIWLKAGMAVLSLVLVLSVAMLGRMFVLADRVAENTAAIAVQSARVDELSRRVEKLEEGQAQLRRGQEEIISLLRARLSDNSRGAPGRPGRPGGGAPEVSAAPGGGAPSVPPGP